jgi:hypothetical protein
MSFRHFVVAAFSFDVLLQLSTSPSRRKFAAQYRSPQKSPQNSCPWVTSMTYGVVRAFQVIVNAFSRSSEKAGVGGSTPSLATIIPKNLAA